MLYSTIRIVKINSILGINILLSLAIYFGYTCTIFGSSYIPHDIHKCECRSTLLPFRKLLCHLTTRGEAAILLENLMITLTISQTGNESMKTEH